MSDGAQKGLRVVAVSGEQYDFPEFPPHGDLVFSYQPVGEAVLLNIFRGKRFLAAFPVHNVECIAISPQIEGDLN